jgi:hypothetical protein
MPRPRSLPRPPVDLKALHASKPIRRVTTAWIDDGRRHVAWRAIPGINRTDTPPQGMHPCREREALPERVRRDLAATARQLRAFTVRELALAATCGISNAHSWLQRHADWVVVSSTTSRNAKDPHRYTWTGPCTSRTAATPAAKPRPATPSRVSPPTTCSPAAPPPAPPAGSTRATTARALPPATASPTKHPFAEQITRLIPRTPDGVAFAWLGSRLRLRPASLRTLIARIPDLIITTNQYGAPAVILVEQIGIRA